MKQVLKISVLVIVFTVLTSFVAKRVDYSHGRQNNVCKVLKDNVLVYFVFVDTKETSPWTEFDIRSTLDSMQVAINWIQSQASNRGVFLNIRSDYFIGKEYTTVRKNLTCGTVQATATTPNARKGLQDINKWADGISARIGKEIMVSPKDGIPDIKNPNNTERLIAHLRDENRVESVVLLFMVNNYFRNDISLPLNQLGSDDVEFAIVSYKYPSVIAQNILTLFGASDLYETFYRRNSKNIELAGEYFPKDIMQDAYGKSITNFEVGDFTSYLIGWNDKLDSKYSVLLNDKVMGF
jgi:hypothetical protein